MELAQLSEVVGEPVHDLERLSGGASHETWSFRAGGRRLIARVDAHRDGLGLGLAAEAALVRAAEAAGVPVARIVASGDDFVICEHVEGETIPRKILRDDEFIQARRLLPEQAASALARIHSITVDGLTEHDPLAWCRAVLDSWPHPHPAFELAMRRLEQTRPAPSKTSLVHGDFRTGNLLVGEDGLRAVLDWELAHLGDPLEDLGWFCVRAWRFGSNLRAGGLCDVDELVAQYEKAGGATVDRDALRWWELMGTMRWGAICIIQVQRHLSGARSLEHAAIGRRICEAEHDVLLLLEEP